MTQAIARTHLLTIDSEKLASMCHHINKEISAPVVQEVALSLVLVALETRRMANIHGLAVMASR